MKKLLIILMPILMLFTGCSSEKNKALISTDATEITKETAQMKGIELVPSFESKSSIFDYESAASEDLVYQWETNEGKFLEGVQALENKDDSNVIWIPESNDSSDKSIDINLTVKGFESKKVLATTKLTLIFKDDSYKIV